MMKLKKILRIVGVFLYWFILGNLILLCVLGKNTIIINIALVFYGINILVYIIKYIFERISDSKNVKNYKLIFYYLSQSHKQRYYWLLKGDIEGAKEFEDLMKMCSDTILKVGPSIASYKTITKKEQKEVLEMIDKARVLLTVTQPPV